MALRGSQVSRNIEVRVRSAKKGVPFRPQVPLGPLSASRRWFTSSSGQLQRRKKGRTEGDTSVLQGSTPRLCPRGQTAPQHAGGRSVHPHPGSLPRSSHPYLSPCSNPYQKCYLPNAAVTIIYSASITECLTSGRPVMGLSISPEPEKQVEGHPELLQPAHLVS